MVNRGPTHGTLTLNANGSFTYTPAANYNGSDTFTYHASDGALNSNIATVSISVHAINHAPVAVNDSYTTNEDTVLTVSAPGVLSNDTDIDGDSLTAAVVSGPSHGTLTLNSNGSFTYTPAANYNGSDSFTYHANDGTANSNVATVSITVNPVNDVPVAANDSYSTNQNTTLTVAAPGVLSNDTDVDGDTLTAALVSSPVHGTLALNPNGSFTYTPTANFTGTDSFTYRADDGHGGTALATVTVQVKPIAPTCVTIQRGTFGQVADAFIWSALPRFNFDTSRLYTSRLYGLGETRSLVRFGLDSLPRNAVIKSATLGLKLNRPGSRETIQIYRITQSWNERQPTWNSFANKYDSSKTWGSFVAKGTGFVSADVTSLVSAWASNSKPNYGLMLKSSLNRAYDEYISSETGTVGWQPSLTVCYIANAALTLTKSASPATYNAAGQTINYSYVILNSGNVTLDGPFTVSDDKATVTCPATSSLAPGATVTCAASYTIQQSDLDAGSVTNHATATNGSATSNVAQATVTAVQQLTLSVEQDGQRQRHGDEQSGGHQLWCELLGQL